MKKRNKHRRVIIVIFLVLIMIFLLKGIDFLSTLAGGVSEKSDFTSANDVITSFAKKNDLSMDEWPEELIQLLDRNPETEEFVLQYPLKKNTDYSIHLDEYENCKEVPLFLQWDERWGYTEYGNTIMGLSGCGPTCLSMVCVYLLNDTSYDPRYIANFSENNGYCVPGSGSAWSLISEGGKELGLDVVEIPLDEERIVKNLKAGNPIICIMGPGDFTTTGHFIVMTEYTDGKIKVNDPNSRANSEKLWNFEDIKYQIRNLWACRV